MVYRFVYPLNETAGKAETQNIVIRNIQFQPLVLASHVIQENQVVHCHPETANIF